MDFRILGPLEVLDDGRTLDLGGAKQRAALAVLALHANRVVAHERLIEALWDEEPPDTARKALQVYVSQLRKVLGHDRLETKPRGYLLRLAPEELDLTRFELLQDDGKPEQALALWRGDPLADFADQRFAQPEIARLEELRLSCLEQRIERDLADGRHAELVGELDGLAGAYPLREHLRAQLMLALYRSGRQAEALDVYQSARVALVDGLGIEPGPELRELHQQVLTQDPALDLPAPKRPERMESAGVSLPPEAPATMPESRKTVTVLFCDLADSTELGERLDPESLRGLMTRWYSAMREPVERHGGTVEKFVGDAAMAVFGVPHVHEDDALRAVRAAVEMREALTRLNEELAGEGRPQLRIRIGVNSGEVVTGDHATTLVTGDAVNVAARLEQSAGRNEILLGARTHALIRSAVVAEPLAPLRVKGKREPVAAWRLLSVSDEEVPQRRLDTPLVNREAELRRLIDGFDVTVRERTCTLVTILGAAGVGKSRLAHELMASLGQAAVVRGRCVSYGEGITYQPVVDVVRELEPQLSQLRLDRRVVTTLRSLLGGDDSTDSTDEIAFAVRKLLEAAAEDLPLVCVFDDIQWGEPAFLELIEQIVSLSRDAPLMLCCIGRLELHDRDPGFGRGHPNATTVVLEGLLPEETDRLIAYLAADAPVSTALRDRIREAAEGNPLFVEEMIRLLREAGDGEVSVPPSIHALLTARLDQLDPAERAVLQRGAVEGRVFHRGAVNDLAPDESRVGARLAALVRKGLLHPEHTRFSGEDAYRFRHQLMCDAAYETLPKTARAELHERFARWLGSHTLELVDSDDLVGYHLEQAYRYRIEIWPLDDHARMLGARASELLSAAGARALGRNDVGAAEKLLRRALSLRSKDDPAVALRLDLTHALFLSGEFTSAGDLVRETASLAAGCGDRVGELRARLAAARLAVQMPPQDGAAAEPSTELLALAEEARPVFTEAGDEVALADAWVATAWAQLIRSRWGAMLDAVEHAITHARQAGYTRWERELPVWKGTALFYGPTPVEEMLRWQNDEQPQHSMALNHRAVLEAMCGRFDAARALLTTADNAAAERGETLWRAGGAMATWEVETLAGDPVAAERAARRTCDWLEELGETGFRSLASGQLAWSLYALDRLDGAERLTQQAEGLASVDDVLSNMLWRQVRARLHARAGRYSEGEQLAREAVSLGEETEMLNWHAHALVDLGGICVLAGRRDEGRRHLAHALELYERKGNIVSAAHVRAALGGPDAPAELVPDGPTF